jgi:hypothetical protein
MVMIIKTSLCEPCEGLLVIVTTRVMDTADQVLDILVEWNGIKQCLLCFFMSQLLQLYTIYTVVPWQLGHKLNYFLMCQKFYKFIS